MRRPLLVAALALGPKLARAADDLPELQRPQTLPELTHPAVELSLETTFASVALTPGAVVAGPTGGSVDLRTREALVLERVGLETPLGSRRWFAGASYSLATGDTPSGGRVAVAGNPELWARGVWASVTGIAFGGGGGVVIPLRAWTASGDSLGVATAASSVRAWDRAVFDANALTTRAFVDMRDAVGPFVLQLRQAIEVALDTRNVNRYTFAEVGTLYAGFRITELVAVGAQVDEYYSLEPDVSDLTRAHWSLGGDVRLTTRYFRPMFAVMTNLGSPLRALSSFGAPLSASPDSFVGLRIGLDFVLDPPKGAP